MSLKYRIRLKNERVIGPFSAEEIGELFLKGHIEGTEMCQQFPIGDWKPLQNFQDLRSLVKIIDEKNLRVEEPTASVPEKAKRELTKTGRVRPLAEQTKSNQTFNEFKFGKDVKIEVNYDELEQKYQTENPNVAQRRSRGELEKTVVLRKKVQPPEELDKTVVVKSKFETPKKEKPQEEVKPVVVKKDPPPPTRQELIEEKTEFINLAHALPTINAQLSVSEVELDKQAKIEENQEKKRLRELREIMLREEAMEEEGVEEDEVEIVEEFSREKKEFEQKVVIKKKKRGMSIIALLAFMGVFYFFMQGDEKPKVVGPLFIDVKFPITAPYENIPAANTALLEGRNLYSQNSYKMRVGAAASYLISLQNRFSGNEAMGEIILTYTELLDNAKDRSQSANTIYKFLQLAESKIVTDVSVATGAALFYGKIGKYDTGVYTVKNFLRAGNKATPKLYTYYLYLLVNAGDFVEARKVFSVLNKIPKKPFEAYYELSQFQLADDKPAEAKTIIEEGLKYYPNSVLLLLQYANILMKEQSLKKFEETVEKIKVLQAENSPAFTATYLEYLGYLAALKGNNKDAALFFKKSLELKESDELRAALSRLEIAGDKPVQALILESKVIGLLKKAKQEYKNKNIDTAFQFIIEAVDADPDYVPAVIFQAELNTYRGFFESAIYSLQRIIGVHQQNFQLKKKLVEVYISAFKFEEAERMLAEMAQTKFATTSEYASLMASFLEAKRNVVVALRWYERALARDPLSDSDMYKMAKILVRNKKFTDAKVRLSKALLLDPKNVYYHALYSEILYEQDGTDPAIGYLRDIITELGEDPVLISAITAAYFKSGQIKEFQAYYKKVQDMPKKDEAFYEVLIAAAKLEGRKDEYIAHSRDLLKLNPGNLKVRMDLGELLFEERRFDEAIAEFKEIQDKLSSYPKVHYQLARVYLAKNDIKMAREMAEKELELNPNLDSAHFIMGEVHRINKEYREAILKYEKAISLNPKSIDGLVAMASIRLQQNYASESLELLNRALKEDLSNPQVHKLMGDAYRAAGQRALAREKYEDYLKLNPGATDKEMIESLIRNLK